MHLTQVGNWILRLKKSDDLLLKKHLKETHKSWYLITSGVFGSSGMDLTQDMYGNTYVILYCLKETWYCNPLTGRSTIAQSYQRVQLLCKLAIWPTCPLSFLKDITSN